MQLACDKSGSRVLDKLWLVASVKQKVSIAGGTTETRASSPGRRLWKVCVISTHQNSVRCFECTRSLVCVKNLIWKGHQLENEK